MLKGKSSKFDVEIEEDESEESLTVKDALVAWSPFILVLVFLLITSTLVPAIHDPLSAIKSSVPIYTGEGAAPYTFTWVATPGVLILIAAFIGGIIQKCPIGEIFGVLGKTIVQMLKTIITIMAVLATAKIMGYSGMTQSITRFYRSCDRKLLSTCCNSIDRIYWNIRNRKFYIKQCSVL